MDVGTDGRILLESRCFVHNKVAVRSIIEGSQCAELRGQVHELWVMLATRSNYAGVWFERVPSKLNIADCPSRLDREWARVFHQGMEVFPVLRSVADDL